MPRLTIRLARAGREPAAVLLDVDDDSSVADLGRALGDAMGVGAEGVWVEGAELTNSATFGDVRLSPGALVAVRRTDAASAPAPATRGWQLHVVSGYGAGAIWELPIGTHVIGRSGAYAIETDARMSRAHAQLDVTAEGATVMDLGSSNGTYVDGTAVSGEPVQIGPGQLLRVGDTLMTIAHAVRADAATHAGPTGTVEVTRPPRIRPGSPARKVVFPAQLEATGKRRIPWIAMVLPALLGVVMAVLMKSPMYLAMAFMSPVMMLGNVWMERRDSRSDARQAAIAYDEKTAAATKELSTALEAETAARRALVPDAAQVMLTATLPTRALWQRRRLDADAYQVRVGTADLDSETTVETERAGVGPQTRTVYSVPVNLSLRDQGVIGVAGPASPARQAAAWLVAQLVVHHAPRDLSVAALLRKDATEFEFLRWLPHARPEGEGPAAFVGNDSDTIAARIAELSELVRQRQKLRRDNHGLDRSSFSTQVVILDGARELRSLIGVAQLLKEGPSVGVFFICVEDEDRLLPEECTATVVIDPELPTRCTVHRDGWDARDGVLIEAAGSKYAERLAVGLAPLVDVNPEDSENSLPDTARLLDVVSLEPPTADGIRARWQLDGQTTRMPLGAGTDGIFTLDLRSDGPHGLIAGTTGSGKSELLQSMIASLAIGNRPDAMNFVLVDYKGGSAFKDCVRLPHTVGMVTDLDTRLVGRALTSLGAELKRREHILAEVGVKDIEDYQDLSARTPGGLASLPRLAIVIDEFASLARELPEFVTGLVNIAQRGRSLGIHMILATQRPTGVVSPEIRANTNMRLSLRVTDASESTDVLDAPDAARIAKSTPGRGFARLGAGALVPFQSGRVGGRRPGVRAAVVRPPFAAIVSWGELGYALPQPPAGPKVEDDLNTDLAVLVDAIASAAQAEGQAEQRSPWLPALPEKILLDSLETVPDPSRVTLVVGVEDLPEAQLQRPRGWDLGTEGHLLVMGASRSGRSQLLRTLAAAASAYPVDDVHLYGLDFGNAALQALEALPHCGAVVSRTQVDRGIRLLTRLRAEMDRRQQVLSASGHADIVEQRANTHGAARLPHIVVLLDRWEGFMATLGDTDAGAHLDTIMGMMREGSSLGIHLALTGDRSLGAGRIASLSENKHVLRLPEKGDASLFGLRERDMPDHHAAGRMLSAATGTETQIALLALDDSAPAQAAVLADLGAAARARGDAGVRPFRVDVLPTSLTDADALGYDWGDAGRLLAPVGVGGDDLRLRGFDMGDPGSAFIVAGPARSGRSTLLHFAAVGLVAAGAEVVIVAPRASALRDLAGKPGVRAVITDPSASTEVWEEVLVDTGQPLVVIFDDAEGLRDSAAGPLMQSVLRGERGQTSLILGGHVEGVASGFSGWQVDVKKARRGVLLAPPTITDGDLVGARLTRTQVGSPPTPGRALFHSGNGDFVTVAVPHR